MADSEYNDAIQGHILRSMPGGPELVAFYGRVPWFHDDEIERLELVSDGKSRLAIRSTIYGSHVEQRVCRVTFEITEIVELRLDHFYNQNALFALRLRPAAPLVGPLYGVDPSAEDVEMVIEPAVGIEGVIRCRGISVTVHEIRTRRPKLHSRDWP